MTAPLSMKQTAAEVGLAYETFRKAWPQWVRDYAFPQPEQRPGRMKGSVRHQWNAAEVAAWREGRKRGLGRRHVPPSAANDESIPAAVAHRVAAERLRLAANMSRSA